MAILTPINKLILKYQSDQTLISEVVQDFLMLPATFKVIHGTGNGFEMSLLHFLILGMIKKPEYDFILGAINKRSNFLLGPVHLMANTLDPRFFGEGLSIAQQQDVEKEISGRVAGEEANWDPVIRELNTFLDHCKREKTAGSHLYKQLMKGNKTASQFWGREGGAWPSLQVVGTRVFALVTSTAASERSWSAMGFLHNKLRNRLQAKTLNKLMFVRTNHKLQLCEETSDSEDPAPSDDEEEHKHEEYEPDV